jgi:hypothetical protein
VLNESGLSAQDDFCARAASYVWNYGISYVWDYRICWDLMSRLLWNDRCSPPCWDADSTDTADTDALWSKITDAYTHAQNEPGSRVHVTITAALDALPEPITVADVQVKCEAVPQACYSVVHTAMSDEQREAEMIRAVPAWFDRQFRWLVLLSMLRSRAVSGPLFWRLFALTSTTKRGSGHGDAN